MEAAATPETIIMNTRITHFHREVIRTWIEEATGKGMSVEDSLPDTLVATAQSLSIEPVELQAWIYDKPDEWTASALTNWARRNGLGHGS